MPGTALNIIMSTSADNWSTGSEECLDEPDVDKSINLDDSMSEAYQGLDNPDTDNNTWIKHTDLPVTEHWPDDFLYNGKREYYEHLNELNDGKKNGPHFYNDKAITRKAALHLVDAVGKQLDLNGFEIRQAKGVFTNLDRERLGLRLDLVAYCVCAYIVEQSQRNERRAHPNVPEETRDDVFLKVAEDLDLRHQDIVKTYGKIQHRVGDRPATVERSVL